MKRDDYEIVVNGLNCKTGSKVINIALTHRRDSVQLHMDLRDDPDDRDSPQLGGESGERICSGRVPSRFPRR